MLFYAALLFSFFFPTTDELSLGGVVFDLNAAVMSDVHVMLEHTTDRQQWTATTLSDGTFRFDHLALGTYRVKVQKESYFENSIEVRLETSKTIEFTLAPVEALKQEIEVVARPEPINPDSVSSQNTVNEQVIQNIPYTGRRDFLNALTLCLVSCATAADSFTFTVHAPIRSGTISTASISRIRRGQEFPPVSQ